MNRTLVQKVLRHYDLGPLENSTRPLVTGFQHGHWRFHIGEQEYLLKKMNPKVYHGYLKPDYLNYAESKAEKWAQAGVPVAHSIQGDMGYVTVVDQDMFLLSRWIPGKVIEAPELSLDQIHQIGALIGSLHHANLTTRNKILPPMWVDVLGEDQEREWQTLFREAYRKIFVNPVLSHRDINLHNIIWNDGKPTLIDWENVGVIDKGLEIFGVMINCISDFEDEPDADMIHALLTGYQDIAGSLPWLDEAHSVACATSWLAWLGYLAELRHAEPTPIDQPRLKQEVVISYRALSFILQYRDAIMKIIRDMTSLS